MPWYSMSGRGNVAYSTMQFGQMVPKIAPPPQLALVTANATKKMHCWEGYERVPNTRAGTDDSCRKKDEKKKKKRKKKRKNKKDGSLYKSTDSAAKFRKDRDGDGKVNETKKVTDFSDRNGNGKPDAFEKSSSSEYDSSSESDGEMVVSVTDSSSEDEKGVKKKRSNASAKKGCGCGCDGTSKTGLTKTIDKAAKNKKAKKNGVIHRANDGKHGVIRFGNTHRHTHTNTHLVP